MAIKLIKTLPTGVAAEYHRVTRLTMDYDSLACTAQVSSYLSEGARRAGVEPLQSRGLVVRFESVPADLRAAVYEAFMAHAAPAPEASGELLTGAGGEQIAPQPRSEWEGAQRA